MRCHAPHQPRLEDEGEVELNIKEEQGCKCCLSSFQMKLVIIGLKLDGVAARSDTSDSVSSLGQWQSRETDPFYMLHITTNYTAETEEVYQQKWYLIYFLSHFIIFPTVEPSHLASASGQWKQYPGFDLTLSNKT